MRSTFAKKPLNEKQKPEHKQTVVVHGNYQEYFETVRDEIVRELPKGRAILIVFSDKPQLDRYQADLL